MDINLEKFSSYTKIYRFNKNSRVRYWFWGLITFLAFLLFLPWTQNIRGRGKVTTLFQDKRPQELNAIIGGQITKWYKKEGDLVKAGDTILHLSEVKTDYLDPDLISRTNDQLNNKQQSIDFYRSKVGATDGQINALEQERNLKIEQTRNKLSQQQRKVETDKIDLEAVRNELSVAQRQIDAARVMLDSGVISMVDYERRKVNYQNTQAKLVSNQNKYDNSRQELTIIQIELNSIEQSAAEKINKAVGEQYQTQSAIANSQAEQAKLRNQISNYSIRNGMYYITAPQDGQVVQMIKAGIGEYVKEGEQMAVIVPNNIKYAVELFVDPVDLPLLAKEQKVRFWFDGFPAIVFSGWPNSSYGTFGGKINVIENTVNKEGKFRILVNEDPDDKPWPQQLKIGAGAQGMALLKNVPIWYELWRNINGFPPDYYKPSLEGAKK